MTPPIPTQREGAAGGPEAMLTYVAGTVSRLEESVDRGFREIRETLANHYVPRNEIDRRFDDTNLDVAALEARVQTVEERAAAEARDRQARLEQADRDRAAREETARLADAEQRQQARRDYWTRVGVLASSSLALLGTATGVVLHFH